MSAAYRLIMASAGSGKTFALTHAYVAILRAGLEMGRAGAVERILATTFTRAAAGEIVGRVMQLLAGAAADDAKRAELSENLTGKEVSREEAGRLLETMAGHLHRLRIGTLDSFMVKAAVAFGPELGLPANYRIAEGAEDKRLRLEAIERLLEEEVESPVDRERMLDLMIYVNQGKWPREIAPKLAVEFSDTYNAFLGGSEKAWAFLNPPKPKLDRMGIKKLLVTLEAVLPPMIPLTGGGTPHSNWVGFVDKLLEYGATGNWEGLVSHKAVAAFLEGGDIEYSSKKMPASFARAIEPLVEYARLTLLGELHAGNVSLWQLLSQFDGHYQKLKETRGTYQFEDFTRKLLEAAVFDDPEKGRQELFFRLDSKIDHILLDEFQDTSIPQWKVLEPLVEEVVSGAGRETGGAERTLLCVGDVKQTLYAWRNAEPKLFGELKKKWGHLEEEKLLISHRSSQVVMDAVNDVFLWIGNNPALQSDNADRKYQAEAGKTWRAWFEKHETRHAQRPGFARLRVCAVEEGEKGNVAAVNLAADLVERRLKESPGEEIAVLFRWKKQIPRLMELLRRRGDFAANEGGSPLTDDSAVTAALSLLHLLDHPGDSAAVYHVGTSPLGKVTGIFDGMSPAALAGVLKNIRRQLADIGYGALLNKWLMGFAAEATPRNLRRFSELVSAAHQFSAVTDPGAFVEAIKDLKVEDAVSARVKVMTIHAAKGRQFDTVILPDLDGKFIRHWPAILARRPHVLAAYDRITRYRPLNILRLDGRLMELYQDACEQKVVEELCGLYVAMTRAKFGLEMIVQPQRGGKLYATMAGVLCGALVGSGSEEGGKVLWEAKGSKLPPPIPLDLPTEGAGEIEVRVRAAEGRRMRPTVSPSSLEGGGLVELGRALSLEQGEGLAFGSLMHAFFECVEWLPGAVKEDALRRAGRKIGASEKEIDSAMSQFAAICGREKTVGAMKRPSGEVDLWRERAFAVRVNGPEGEVTLEGRLDRVVVKRERGVVVSAEVVDFKTDGVGDAEKLKLAVERYRPQVGAYKLAVGTMLGLPAEKVTGVLVFVIGDQVVEI